MTEPISHTVAAPGAVLTYDVREPETPSNHRPLFIFGSPMGASGFEQLVSHFGDRIEDVAKAHMADLEAQADRDVTYLRYWVDEGRGRILCLVEAPTAEDAHAVHREAHGLVADDIFQVKEGS
jgi:hypothetical protein